MYVGMLFTSSESDCPLFDDTRRHNCSCVCAYVVTCTLVPEFTYTLILYHYRHEWYKLVSCKEQSTLMVLLLLYCHLYELFGSMTFHTNFWLRNKVHNPGS
jgi:hypothetical protein